MSDEAPELVLWDMADGWLEALIVSFSDSRFGPPQTDGRVNAFVSPEGPAPVDDPAMIAVWISKVDQVVDVRTDPPRPTTQLAVTLQARVRRQITVPSGSSEGVALVDPVTKTADAQGIFHDMWCVQRSVHALAQVIAARFAPIPYRASDVDMIRCELGGSAGSWGVDCEILARAPYSRNC